MEVTKWLKPSVQRATNWWPRECAGRNASERRASLEKDDVQADYRDPVLGVKFPGPTRHSRRFSQASSMSGLPPDSGPAGDFDVFRLRAIKRYDPELPAIGHFQSTGALVLAFLFLKVSG